MCQLNQPIFLDLSEAYQITLIQESAGISFYDYKTVQLLIQAFNADSF